MGVSLGHCIFGYSSVSSLLKASESKVQENLKIVEMGNSWHFQCHITISLKQNCLKIQMEIKGKSLEHMFIDLVPISTTLQGIPECKYKNFHFYMIHFQNLLIKSMPKIKGQMKLSVLLPIGRDQ